MASESDIEAAKVGDRVRVLRDGCEVRVFRCPACGWQYDADGEHEKRGLARDEHCDFSKWVPYHHLHYSPVLCDGSNCDAELVEGGAE